MHKQIKLNCIQFFQRAYGRRVSSRICVESRDQAPISRIVGPSTVALVRRTTQTGASCSDTFTRFISGSCDDSSMARASTRVLFYIGPLISPSWRIRARARQASLQPWNGWMIRTTPRMRKTRWKIYWPGHSHIKFHNGPALLLRPLWNQSHFTEQIQSRSPHLLTLTWQSLASLISLPLIGLALPLIRT